MALYTIKRNDSERQQLGGTFKCPFCGRETKAYLETECDSFGAYYIQFFKFDKRYSVVLACCGARAPLDPELGKDVSKGRCGLKMSTLNFTGSVRCSGKVTQINSERELEAQKTCRKCGNIVDRSCLYCPKCGKRL